MDRQDYSLLQLHAAVFSGTIVFFSFPLPLSCAASSPTAFIMRRRLQASGSNIAAAAVRLTAFAAAAAAADVCNASSCSSNSTPPSYCILMNAAACGVAMTASRPARLTDSHSAAVKHGWQLASSYTVIQPAVCSLQSVTSAPTSVSPTTSSSLLRQLAATDEALASFGLRTLRTYAGTNRFITSP